MDADVEAALDEGIMQVIPLTSGFQGSPTAEWKLTGDESLRVTVRTPLSQLEQERAMGRKALLMAKRQEQIAAAVAKCKSMAGVMRELGLRVAGSNYRTVNWVVRKLGLDTSHFTGQGHRKGCVGGMVPPRPLSECLVKDSFHNTSALRKKLLKEGVLKARCNDCQLETWLDKPIPLELDHIDGDHFNNLLDNLSLLCPNCHAFTSTYRGKNKGRSSDRPGGGIGNTQGS